MSKQRPDLPTLDDRAAGVLLHLSSLPTRYGVGDPGPAAFEFLDFLENSGQRWWPMLPLGPAGPGNSPYQASSAFAGSSLWVSPDEMLKEGLLSASELENVPAFAKKQIDYPSVSRYKHRLLGLAFARFLGKKAPKEFEVFERENAEWLEDYALYAALQQLQKGTPWTSWQDALRRRDPHALQEARKNLHEQTLFPKFAQYEFFRQWKKLKDYARDQGIGLIGDLPIFVSLDSADVWAHPDYFRLNSKGMPTVVAGVPPDLFSKTGQRS